MIRKLIYNFLVDRPIKDNEGLQNLDFGHDELGKTLANIVAECNAPFTIGLFGKWGTGKSTLSYYLRKELKKKNIPVIIFDVWKHEKDALRRTFLREIVFQLKSEQKIDECFELDERLDKSITKTISKPNISLPWKKIAKILGFIFITFIVILIIDYYCFSSYLRKTFLDKLLIGFFSAAIGSIASIIPLSKIIFWIKDSADFFLRNFVSSKAITYSIDKFSDPHEFQKQFEEVIRHIKDRRILIVFDNLDRVASNIALEVLTTIKTFLEPSDELVKEKEVVFLVPCDAQALKEHIKAEYNIENNSSYDPDEFLRKFFNATVWIPDFIVTELEQFTRKKLRETKVPHFDDDRISALITTAFRDNPRQIIQFINILLANYILIKERSGEGKDFPSDFLDKHTVALCRYLILEYLFPDIMKEIKSKHLFNIDELTLEKLNKSELSEHYRKKFFEIKDRTKSLAPLENANIFFYMRRSEEEKQLPGIENFFTFLEDGKVDEAESFVEEINEYDEKRTTLSILIKMHLEKIKNPVVKAYFINTLLTVLHSKNKSLDNSAYSSIYNEVLGLTSDNLLLIQPDLFAEIVLSKNEHLKGDMFDKWIKITNADEVEKAPQEFLKKLINVFITYKENLSSEQLKLIRKNLIHARFYELWAVKPLVQEHDVQKKFLSRDYVSGFINSIPEKGEVLEKIEILNKFLSELYDKEIGTQLLQKITSLLSTFAGINDLEVVLLELSKLFRKKKEILSKIDDNQLWNNLWSNLQALITARNINNQQTAIPLAFILFLISPIKNNIKGQINDYFAHANLESIKFSLSHIEVEELLKDDQFRTTLMQRAIESQAFLDYLYNEIFKQPDEKYELLKKVADQNLALALSKMEKENEYLPNKASLIRDILVKYDHVGIEDKSYIIKICNLTRCADDEGIKSLFVDKIIKQLTQRDKQQQQIIQGISSKLDYLGKDRLRGITDHLFKWIKEQGRIGNYFIIPIKFIYDLKQLTDEEYDELIYYVFQVLRNASDISELEIAFEILLEIKPKYRDHEKEFIDLKNRIEREGNENIKKLLIKNLLSLKPQKVKDESKEFWDNIEGINAKLN